MCVSYSRRRLLLHPTPVQQPSLSLGVDLVERVSPQLTCQAWVSSSRLAASVPSGSISSSSASLLLVPRRPADIPVGQEDLWGKPPSPNFPGYQSRQEWGGKRGCKGALCLVVLLPLSQPTEPLDSFLGHLLEHSYVFLTSLCMDSLQGREPSQVRSPGSDAGPGSRVESPSLCWVVCCNGTGTTRTEEGKEVIISRHPSREVTSQQREPWRLFLALATGRCSSSPQGRPTAALLRKGTSPSGPESGHGVARKGLCG